MKRRMVFALTALTLCAVCAYARAVPALTGRVTDEAGVMRAEDKRTLEAYLSSFENEAGIQIAALTVRSLDGDSIESFAHEAAEKWRLGQQGEDNGALLVVALAERKIRIETGYGLEGALTDTKCGLIIRNAIAPSFRSGDYSGGIVNGVKAMATAALGREVQAENAGARIADGGGSDGFGIAAALLTVLFWLFVFSSLSSRRRRGGLLPWLLLWGAFGGSGGNSRTNRRVRTFDSDFWGAGSGSGFSGGGGRFGGGGASGGW
ncbi:MAG: TPM domain-containing protein [Treponema sp.]